MLYLFQLLYFSIHFLFLLLYSNLWNIIFGFLDLQFFVKVCFYRNYDLFGFEISDLRPRCFLLLVTIYFHLAMSAIFKYHISNQQEFYVLMVFQGAIHNSQNQYNFLHLFWWNPFVWIGFMFHKFCWLLCSVYLLV